MALIEGSGGGGGLKPPAHHHPLVGVGGLWWGEKSVVFLGKYHYRHSADAQLFGPFVCFVRKKVVHFDR
jgi:hypothetical protein